MVVQAVNQGAKNPSANEAFAIVQQISSQIDKDRMPKVIDAAKGLQPQENQLIVDLLGMVIERHHRLLKNADRVLLLLTGIASPANIVGRNRILSSKHITSQSGEFDMYKTLDEPTVGIQLMRRGKKDKDTAPVFSEILLTWAHLSHPNILPLYGAFLEGDDGPVSLMSLSMSERDIVGYAKTLPQSVRMPLVLDVVEGLCHLHQLNIVHGRISPENVLISGDGRALITGLNISSETTDFEVRYSAPELLEDDTQPTKGADMWSLGCIIYEILSGNVPFCQHRQESKVTTALLRQGKPIRPGHEGVGGEKIDDDIWRPVSTCFEFEAEDRPSCLQFQKIFATVGIRDDRPPQNGNPLSEAVKPLSIDLEQARSILMRIIDSDDPFMAPPSKIPDNLREPLSGLTDSLVKAEAVAVAAKKLGPKNTQILVDVLDLVTDENPSSLDYTNATVTLLRKIMIPTHIFPQCYKTRRMRYDSTPIAEGDFGKVYKERDLDLCINMVTDPGLVSDIVEYLTLWARASHSNILPLYGVFQDDTDEIPRFCLVSPYLKNGVLHNYAPLLPQESRIPLISDVISGLAYLHGLNYMHGITGADVLISDEGRALIATFRGEDVLTVAMKGQTIRSTASYTRRFYSPQEVEGRLFSKGRDVWAFGCLCYEVLSRKVPYYQYATWAEIRSAFSRGEPLARPGTTHDNDMDKISDQFWSLITKCCMYDPEDRLTIHEIQEFLANMEILDDRDEAQKLPGPEIGNLRLQREIDWDGVEKLLSQIQVELLRTPLSKVVQHHIKDVTTAAVKFNTEDIRTLVDFLDLALKYHITLSDERNRVLALLSRITTSTRIFPQRHELKEIKYHPSPIAEGGFGRVHRGLSDSNICVKVTTKVDPTALTGFVKELIVWSHSSHPNVLPFYGVFLDESHQICLVSPFMKNGNLQDYAPRLPQKSRFPFILDTIKGLDYLHGLGIVHSDLKAQNVLISDEQRGLITDFGASHVITATAKGGSTGSFVTSTLRFAAPETVKGHLMRPTKEGDIWSFGCLCYEVLSRKLPYYQYTRDFQIATALCRNEPPKRPGDMEENADAIDDLDFVEDEDDWDDIDDPTWDLIKKCCTPRPEDRLKCPRIQELIVDMSIWDSRPEAKSIPGADILKLKSHPDVNLNRVGELLDSLQVQLLAQNTLRYSAELVVETIARLRLEEDDARALVNFWDLVLQNHPFISDENSRILVLLSALIRSTQKHPWRYYLPNTIQYDRTSIGSGSFGKVHQGVDPNLCFKVTNISKLNPDFRAQWDAVSAPSTYSSHPNILPFYGLSFNKGGRGYLIFPYMRNGNLHNYAPRLPPRQRLLLISDVVEALRHLHDLTVIHGNLKGENILVSDEGHALVADFRPYCVNVAAAEGGPTGTHITSTLRFTAPELVKDSQMLPTTKSDIWSIGCLVYQLLSGKVPFYQYSQDVDIRSALSRGELPMRPVAASNVASEIDDVFWELVTRCCVLNPDDRLTLPDLRKWLANQGMQDNRPPAKPSPAAEILKFRLTHHGVDIARAREVLARVAAQLPTHAQQGFGDNENQSGCVIAH